MNISTANTEAYAIYNRFHNDLNLSAKVGAAGILTLKRLVDVPNGDVIMGTLVDTVGMPWGTNKPFPKPTAISDKVFKNLVNNSIVQAFSGFEHYITNLIADIAHFSSIGREIFVHSHTDSEYNPNNPPEYSRCCMAYAEQFAKNHVLATRIDDLCNKLEIDDERISKLNPLFEYFRNIRNCVAHINGVANKDLEEAWADEDFESSVNYWNKLVRKKAPPLPEPIRGQKMKLELTNSINGQCALF